MIPIIPTRVHAILDYLSAAVLILVPLLWIQDAPVAAWVPIILGIGVLVYSLITRYEYSAAKLLPMPLHLMLDAGGGLILAASPWIFGFADEIWVPHLVFGLFEISTAIFTRAHAHRTDLPPGPSPSDRRLGRERGEHAPAH